MSGVCVGADVGMYADMYVNMCVYVGVCEYGWGDNT